MAGDLTFHLCDTERGWVGLVLSPYGLRATTLPRQTRAEVLRDVMEAGAVGPAPEAELTDLPERVSALASGRWSSLALHIDWTGISPFRRAVLEETMRVPPGETRSYGEIAARVGRPGAARAVGRVMATNPLPLVVPCHRVIGSDGGLHGYGGGLDMKASLLRAEGVKVRA
ncbi:MAG: MGMT family protein [Dehalococcoidia bacterium]|nr:MGMT family protein [Dehalococcoidia bacterium]